MTWDDFKEDYDRLSNGIIAGIICAFLGVYLSKWYFTSDWNYSWSGFIPVMKEYTTDILTIAVIPNVLLFYFGYFHWKMDEAVKGVVFTVLVLVGVTIAFI